MSSNKELEALIIAAAEALEVDTPDLTDANNAQRVTILKELNAQKDSAAAAMLAREQADKKAKEAKKLPAYYVPEGKAVTTLRGIISDNEEITVKDLSGEKEAFNALVTSGHIVKS